MAELVTDGRDLSFALTTQIRNRQVKQLKRARTLDTTNILNAEEQEDTEEKWCAEIKNILTMQ